MSKLNRLLVLQTLVLSFGCTSNIQNQINVPPTPESNIILENQKIKWNQIIGDVNERIRTTEEKLKIESKVFGIENLKESKRSSDFVIRIWTEQEALVHCLMISNSDRQWSASMVTGEIMLNRQTGKTYLKRIKSSNNLHPRSGWENLSTLVTDNAIELPLSYKIDEINNPPQPDEGLVKLELRSKGQYGLVFYQRFSESNDARKIVEFVRRLQTEFGVDLGIDG